MASRHAVTVDTTAAHEHRCMCRRRNSGPPVRDGERCRGPRLCTAETVLGPEHCPGVWNAAEDIRDGDGEVWC